MNVIQIDTEKNKLLDYLALEKSPRYSLLAIKKFLDKVISFNDSNVFSAFVTDLIPEYLSCLNQLDSFGVNPSITEGIIKQLDEVIQSELFKEYEDELKKVRSALKNQVQKLKNILNGSSILSSDGHGLIFPVLEKGNMDSDLGLLDNVAITIKHNSKLNKNEFIVIPSQIELDEKLENQLEVSWNLAAAIVQDYKKLKNQLLEIIIKFKKKYANYEGNSLGAALTIGFIQTLLQYYETREIISLKNNIALTGGITEKGYLISVSGDVIKKKVETVFYSNIEKFILPVEDKNAAKSKLAELNSLYPKRRLEIIAVSSLNDLLDRRRLVDVKKQNLVKWSAKKVVKNKYAYVFFFLFLAAILFITLKDIDNNPNNFEYSGTTLLVKNKMDKNLFEKELITTRGLLRTSALLYDSDKDGINEIFLCNETKSSINKNSIGRLAAFDNYGNLIWECKFNGNVRTKDEVFKDEYYIHSILGTIEKDNKADIVVATKHSAFYPSALFTVDAATGKISSDILWHPGLIIAGTVYDLDNDGKYEIIAVCISNGFDASSLFVVEEDKISGKVPSTVGYTLLNLPNAELKRYFIFPKTDLTALFNNRYNLPNSIPDIRAELKDFLIYLWEGGAASLGHGATLRYEVSFDLSKLNPIISDRFRVIRDKQIMKGELNGPLSDTDEYRELLKSKILVWENGKFIHLYPTDFTQ